jgi:hypothetical protein
VARNNRSASIQGCAGLSHNCIYTVQMCQVPFVQGLTMTSDRSYTALLDTLRDISSEEQSTLTALTRSFELSRDIHIPKRGIKKM